MRSPASVGSPASTSLSPSAASAAAIVAGSSYPELAESLSKRTGFPLVSVCVGKFRNGESRTLVLETIRGKHVLIVQTFPNNVLRPMATHQVPAAALAGSPSLLSTPERPAGSHEEALAAYTLNDFLVELLMLVDDCRRSSAASISLVLPYFPYERSDKRDGRTNVGASVVASLLERMGVSRVMTVDLHNAAIAGFFHDIPCDNLFAKRPLCAFLRREVIGDQEEQFCVVSPDAGGIKRAQLYADDLHLCSVVMHKQREYHGTGQLVKKSMLIGSGVAGKTCIIVDDMADTLGTCVAAVEELMSHGAAGVVIVVVHAVLSCEEAFRRINATPGIVGVIVTNTLPPDYLKHSAKIRVVELDDMLADAARRLYSTESLSALFG